MTDQLWKRVRLARLQGLGVDDQVVGARHIARPNQIDAYCTRSRVYIGSGELVNDRCDHRRRVLRRLHLLGELRLQQRLGYDWHGQPSAGNGVLPSANHARYA